jgi:hypothetical protein
VRTACTHEEPAYAKHHVGVWSVPASLDWSFGVLLQAIGVIACGMKEPQMQLPFEAKRLLPPIVDSAPET